MSFFTTSTKQDMIQEQTGDYINKSGMYPVTIKFASVNTSPNGSMAIDFNVDYKGSTTTIYGLRLTNNDGSDNFQKALFNKLLIILGIESLDEPTIESHVVGKDNTPKDFSVLTELSDKEVVMRIQYEYSVYNGTIQERRTIKNFYRVDDYATASEIVNGTAIGTQYNKDLAYAESITYKDGLTKEAVDAWKEGKKNGTNVAAPITSNTKPTSNPFAK